MPLQSSQRCHEDRGGRLKIVHTALNVIELFSAQVAAETGFRDGPVSDGHGSAGSSYGVAAVRNIGKRTAVNKSRHPFDGLNQVRQHGIFQKSHKSTGCA